jgi:hypothetical protein
MSALIASPGAGVYAALVDSEAFDRAFVRLGAVGWPGDLYIAPHATDAAIKASDRRERLLS